MPELRSYDVEVTIITKVFKRHSSDSYVGTTTYGKAEGNSVKGAAEATARAVEAAAVQTDALIAAYDGTVR